MAKRLQLRGGNAAKNNAFTGAAREVTIDTENYQLRIHDGITAGGHVVGAGIMNQTNNTGNSDPYILKYSDIGKHIFYGTDVVYSPYLVIPSINNVSWTIGATITIINQSGSSGIITTLPDVTLNVQGLANSTAYYFVDLYVGTLIYVGQNTWTLTNSIGITV
jgi:hypothetical protein